MKKLSALAIVFALVLAACGGNPGARAATVDEETITVGDVNDLIHVEDGTITKEQFADFLALRIQWVVVERAAREEYGIEISEEEITAEADRIFDEFAEGQTREEFTASRGVTETFLREVAHQSLIDGLLRERFLESGRGVPTSEEIDAQLDQATLELTEVCASHILLGQLQTLEGDELDQAIAAAEVEALDVLDRLDAGEVFADIAVELSTDTQSGAQGGSLGCSTPTRYVDEFRAGVMTAPIGEVYAEPVKSPFGFHVILVHSRTVPSVEEVSDFLRASGVDLELRVWSVDLATAAEVSIESRFGTWEPAPQPRVVPPAD